MPRPGDPTGTRRAQQCPATFAQRLLGDQPTQLGEELEVMSRVERPRRHAAPRPRGASCRAGRPRPGPAPSVRGRRTPAHARAPGPGRAGSWPAPARRERVAGAPCRAGPGTAGHRCHPAAPGVDSRSWSSRSPPVRAPCAIGRWHPARPSSLMAGRSRPRARQRAAPRRRPRRPGPPVRPARPGRVPEVTRRGRRSRAVQGRRSPRAKCAEAQAPVKRLIPG